MNVAVTRAKRLCILVADSSTVSHHKFLKELLDYFKSAEGSIVRSAFDYQGNEDVRMMYGVAAGGTGITHEQVVDKANK